MAARNQFSDDIDIYLGTDGTVVWGIRPDNGEDPHGDEDTLSTKALIPEPETYALTLGLFALLGIAYKRIMR
jgi:hypothetical protein